MPDDLKLNLCYLTCVLENLETWTHSYTQPRISELMIKLDVSNPSQVPFYSCHGTTPVYIQRCSRMYLMQAKGIGTCVHM